MWGMSRPPLPLPESLADVFTRTEARRVGVGSRRLRGADVQHLAFDVYIRTSSLASREESHPAITWRNRQVKLAQAIGRSLPRHAFFCGWTAAVLWDVPVPTPAHDRVDVASIVPASPPERVGVRGYRFRQHLVSRTVRHRLPVITPAALWCTLGPHLNDDGLIALGDALVYESRIPGTQRLRPPLTGLDELRRTMAAGRRPGIGRLRSALPLLSTRSASAPETHLRLRCRAWGFPSPEPNADVVAPNGRLLGCSDLVFRSYRVALEYEGDHHRVDARQWNRDIEKQRDYAQAGWIVIRVTARMLYREDFALRMSIEQALESRGWSR